MTSRLSENPSPSVSGLSGSVPRDCSMIPDRPSPWASIVPGGAGSSVVVEAVSGSAPSGGSVVVAGGSVVVAGGSVVVAGGSGSLRRLGRRCWRFGRSCWWWGGGWRWGGRRSGGGRWGSGCGGCWWWGGGWRWGGRRSRGGWWGSRRSGCWWWVVPGDGHRGEVGQNGGPVGVAGQDLKLVGAISQFGQRLGNG